MPSPRSSGPARPGPAPVRQRSSDIPFIYRTEVFSLNRKYAYLNRLAGLFKELVRQGYSSLDAFDRFQYVKYCNAKVSLFSHSPDQLLKTKTMKGCREVIRQSRPSIHSLAMFRLC